MTGRRRLLDMGYSLTQRQDVRTCDWLLGASHPAKGIKLSSVVTCEAMEDSPLASLLAWARMADEAEAHASADTVKRTDLTPSPAGSPPGSAGCVDAPTD
jgi:hypothetical protein